MFTIIEGKERNVVMKKKWGSIIVFMVLMYILNITSLAALTGNTNAEKVFNYFRTHGYTEQAAAGIVGNLIFESGGGSDIKLNAEEKGSGAGIGMCQWTDTYNSPRRTNFVNYCKSRGYGWPNNNLEVQIEFLIKELRGDYGTIWFFNSQIGYPVAYKMSLSQFKQVTDVELATCVFCACFERAKYSVCNLPARTVQARRFASNPISPSGSTYYPACSSSHTSIVSALQSIGVDSSFASRSSIAEMNGISNYSGTSEQNIQMLNLLKQGKLIKSKGSAAQSDTTAPTITDVKITDRSGSGYTVHCIVRDNSSLSHVMFPTWTPWNNGQDDITWDRADVSGTSWELNYRVNTSAHNNETNCWYVTHIYVYDTAGNCTSVSAGDVYVENEVPRISDVTVTNISESGYTVSCRVTDNDSVDRVQFPTWTVYRDQDDIDNNWWTSEKSRGSRNGNIYTFRVNVQEHNNEKGEYVTHIYAFDACGNYTCYPVPHVKVENTTSSLPTKPSTSVVTKQKQSIYVNSFIKNYGDKTFAIGATASGDGKLSYKSSNKKIATVSSTGKVTIKGIGTAKITITAKATSAYEKETKTITVTVRPKSTRLSSLKNSRSKKMTIKWKRNSAVSGYKIQVATNSSFKNAKTYTIRRNKTVSKTISVTRKKTYYVRMCTYKGNIKSGWSNVKKLKIKK